MKNLFYISVIILICISCKVDRNSLEPTPAKEEKQKIAFVSYRDGNSEIYTMEIDGNNETRLTNNTGWDIRPQFSPDGRKIAYCSERNGIPSIIIMNTDGSEMKVLLSDIIATPIFSPDGQRIALDDGKLILINIDGTNFVEESAHYLSSLFYPEIHFSSDSQLLLFCLDWYKSGNYDICTMSSDGSNLNNLTLNFDSKYDQDPMFSTDGNNILYRSLDSTGSVGNIRRMQLDGSNNINLTGDSLVEPRLPIPSPDGSKIIFTAEGNYFSNNTIKSAKGRPAIFIMDADGSNPKQISDVGAYSSESLFLPNANEIIYTDGGIWCTQLDGNNRRQLIDFSTRGLINSGEYIFFIRVQLGDINSIYRMNVDGSDLIILADQQLNGNYLSVQPLIQ